MIETKSYDTFYRKNLDDLRKMFIWKTRVRDPDLVDELISKFVLHMIENEILEKFNEKIAKYNTYITTCLLRFAQKEANKEKSVKRGANIVKVEYDESLHSEDSDLAKEMDLKSDWNLFVSLYYEDPKVSPIRRKIFEELIIKRTRKEIAKKLCVTDQTVSLHIKAIKSAWDKFYNSN